MNGRMVKVCGLLMVAISLAACENAEKGFQEVIYPPAPSERIARARAAYNGGNYTTALTEAKRAQGNNHPVVRDEAYYLAGMSAHQLGLRDEAVRHLQAATKSRDQLLAGQAHAELGLIYQEQTHYDDAARAFLKAAPVLPAADKSNALYYAAINQQKLGYWTPARTNLMLAAKTAADDAQRQRAIAQMDVTGYTLQVGAFGNHVNAEKQAQQISTNATDAKIGLPRIVPASNKSMHLVHVGQFTTYQTALAARTRLGVQDAIVVPLAGN